MSKIFCKQVFELCEIDKQGNVFICPDCLCNYTSIGNIFENSFDEIFNGEKIQDFLGQFSSQNFKYCNFDLCGMNKNQIDDDLFERLFYENSNKFQRKIVRLTYDGLCNLKCIFCEHRNVSGETQDSFIEQRLKVQSKVKELLPQFDKHGCIISLNSGGEVFASNLQKELIKHIVENYKNLKFEIITNGTLCSKEMIKSLGMEDRIVFIEVSVHAFTEKTYNKVVYGGNYRKLCQNLEYISSLKKEGKIKSLKLNFVINSYNYKEMTDFTKWAHKLDANVTFLPLRKLPNNSDIFDEINISDKAHPLYNDFVAETKKFLNAIDNSDWKPPIFCFPTEFQNLSKVKNANFISKLIYKIKKQKA